MARNPRNASAYRLAVARLKVHPAPCWRNCGRPATTIDHVPALALHEHNGRGCCELRPACAKCNYADGARIAARMKRRRRQPVTASRVW